MTVIATNVGNSGVISRASVRISSRAMVEGSGFSSEKRFSSSSYWREVSVSASMMTAWGSSPSPASVS
jgi:hypothetical protein